MNRTMRRLILLFCLITCMTCMSASAASGKKQALQAYDTFLAGKSSYLSFGVIYLDKNSVPELVFGHEIYTFKNGQMVKIKNELSTFYMPSAYYKKKGVMVISYAHGGYMPSSYERFCKLKSEKLEGKLEIEGVTEMDRSTGKYKKWSYAYNSLNGLKSTSFKNKAAFNKALKKLVGSKKKTKIKMHVNTAAMRKKYLK